ncbi:MAG: hypothetical protein IJ574_05315 [Bacilli bacterium]|nr:hypothetical protein [Bacilli bacterium]
MKNDKLSTIINLFEEKEIRSIWDKEKEEYYYSVVDVIAALTDSPRARKYWNDLKAKLDEEGSQLSAKIGQLKMKAPDGKNRLTDVLNTEGIFRLIQSVPSPKAEPFKVWLSHLGKEEIDNVFDPSKGIEKMIDYYLKKGHNFDWIKLRIMSIIDRKKLTYEWQQSGVGTQSEYAILTNEIYKETFGLTAKELKEYKGLRKENLRDNMSDVELSLTNLGEIATREYTKLKQPTTKEEHKEIAKLGGHTAQVARKDMERVLKDNVVTSNNNLNYKYIEDE